MSPEPQWDCVVKKPSTAAVQCKNHKVFDCGLCKASKKSVQRASSQEAYLTIVRIQRYKGGFDEDLVDCEDEYSFEIGERTFPEVLELVDWIKHIVKEHFEGREAAMNCPNCTDPLRREGGVPRVKLGWAWDTTGHHTVWRCMHCYTFVLRPEE